MDGEIERAMTLRGAGTELAALRVKVGGRPLAIAHRAGNHPGLLRAAEQHGADVIELDVLRHQGRLEVGHHKTIGRLPLLWDWPRAATGWPYRPRDLHLRFAPAWRAGPNLTQVIHGAEPETVFLLDLKGKNPRLGELVVAEARTARPTPPDGEPPPILVCSRFWPVLERAGSQPDARVIYSVGSDEELATVWAELAALPDPAVSIHVRYLALELPHLARFKREGVAVITWPVNDLGLARDLAERGVDGMTIDDGEVLRQVASGDLSN
jgi:glycerophosphoryl diester phosphodiesterase